MRDFSESFYISIITMITGVLALCIRYCLKSKCNDVNVCFGLVQITRDVNAEIATEEKELELQAQGTTTSPRLTQESKFVDHDHVQPNV